MHRESWMEDEFWAARRHHYELREALAEHGLVHEVSTANEILDNQDVMFHSWWLGAAAILAAVVWASCAAVLLAGSEHQLWATAACAAVAPIGLLLCALWRRSALAKLDAIRRA